MLDQDWLKTFAPFGLMPQQNQWQPTGACVFVEHQGVIWCITAAHVLSGAAGNSVGCCVTVNGQQTIMGLTDIYRSTPGVDWVIDATADVAAGPMPTPSGIDIRSIGFDRCLEQKDVIPSMPCLTAGQPYGIPGVSANKATPLILNGVIAGIDALSHRIFISVPTFPGNSGGPIIAYRSPSNPHGGLQVGIPTVFLAGIVTETVIIPNNQPDKKGRPPLHLGSGASFDAVKTLLTGERASQVVAAVKRLPQHSA
jgi:hypothetical protein